MTLVLYVMSNFVLSGWPLALEFLENFWNSFSVKKNS